jgi:NSS family neurotransmitter:Na+ symporter
VAGIATVLSFNLWSSWHPLGAFGRFRDATFFDVLDHLTSNVFLPAGGFMLALFAGWVMPVQLLAGELGLTPRSAALLRFTLRYVAPVGIAAATLAPFWV